MTTRIERRLRRDAREQHEANCVRKTVRHEAAERLRTCIERITSASKTARASHHGSSQTQLVKPFCCCSPFLQQLVSQTCVRWTWRENAGGRCVRDCSLISTPVCRCALANSYPVRVAHIAFLSLVAIPICQTLLHVAALGFLFLSSSLFRRFLVDRIELENSSSLHKLERFSAILISNWRRPCGVFARIFAQSARRTNCSARCQSKMLAMFLCNATWNTAQIESNAKSIGNPTRAICITARIRRRATLRVGRAATTAQS